MNHRESVSTAVLLLGVCAWLFAGCGPTASSHHGQVMRGTLLYFENDAAGCSKSGPCGSGTCGHFRSILLEKEDASREVLIPGAALSFESFKAFDRRGF